AVAAFEQNDFEGARKLLQRVSGSDKTNAADYLDKIERYTRLMKEAARAASASKLDDARSSYQQAAQIKSDGPGNPQEQSALLDLRQGRFSSLLSRRQQAVRIFPGGWGESGAARRGCK